MFRSLLELLVITVSHRGWKNGSAFCAASLDDKEDDHPVRHYIELLRKTQITELLPSEDTEILGKALGDSPKVREFIAALERLIHETLDEIEEDPATAEFERMVNLHLLRLHKKVIHDPATKKLVIAKKMSRKQVEKTMELPTEH